MNLCRPLVLLAIVALAAPTIASAQHGAAPLPPGQPSPTLALNGYCPVCVVKMKKWEKGRADITSTYDGQTYRFPGMDQKKMFDADPAMYVPALGGKCVVCMANVKKHVPGTVSHTALHRGRLFLFPAEDPKKEFLKNPKKYENVDLALQGKCAVCLAMGHNVQGKPEVAAYYKGMRYLFPSPKERTAFLSQPEKFAQKSPMAASATKPSDGKVPARFVSISGKSGCAACSYGVRPIGSPGSLGLAVASANGTVYVVENAEKNYPDLFKKRFDGLQLEVNGALIKQDGRFAWVTPTMVRAIN